MPTWGDRAARAFSESLHALVATMPGGWTSREAGVSAIVTTVPVATLNGVWVDEAGAEAGHVRAALDRVAGTGLPHCLQLRPDCDRALGDIAVERGMAVEAEVPLMVLPKAGAITDAPPPGLTIRVLEPADADHHARIAAAGFEAPEELFRQLISPAALRLPEVRCYLGEAAGTPVTTGIGFTLGDSVGIFNIATPLAQRRLGYGAAVTARAVRDGAQCDARWAWLQASPAGYRVYERLGFQTVESWQCWVSPPSIG